MEARRSKTMFTKENLIQTLIIYQAKIETSKEYLSQLDTPIGDGDHGENMSYGMSVVIERLEAKKPTILIDAFKIVALALLSYTCGPLYSTAMLKMANEAALTTKALPLLDAGLAGIERRSNSQPGEKTMVDVWAPALATLKIGT